MDCFPHAWWFSDIHTFVKQTQSYPDKYAKFHDGLHPDEILLMHWMETIIKAMSKDIQNCC